MKYFKITGTLLLCLAVVGCGVRETTESTNKSSNEASAPSAEIENKGLESKVLTLVDLASSLPGYPDAIFVSCSKNKGQYFVQYGNDTDRITTDVACVEREDNYVLKLTREVSFTKGTLFTYKFYDTDYMKVFGVNSSILNTNVFLRVMQIAERRRLLSKGTSLDLAKIQYVDNQGNILVHQDSLITYGKMDAKTTSSSTQLETGIPTVDTTVVNNVSTKAPTAKVEASAVVVDKDKVNSTITSN